MIFATMLLNSVFLLARSTS